jgi:8-oxo-dGTP diphosphatase
LSGLKKIPTEIHVVAAGLTSANGRFLLQKRGPGGRHGGLWEFPGGKVESGEIPEKALIREIDEELGVTVDAASLAFFGTAREESEGEFPAIVMSLYTAGVFAGDPRGRQGQEWGWFTLDEAARLPLPPVDVELVSRLIAARR